MTVVRDNTLAPATDAGQLLRTVTRLFSELQQRDFACCDVNSSTQCLILTTLTRVSPLTLAALTRTLNVDKAWLSRSTDDLVEQGLLVKAPHPHDRRALLLRLTEAGTLAARDLDAQLNAQSARVLARLPDADQAQALGLLAGLTQALQAELDADLDPAGPSC